MSTTTFRALRALAVLLALFTAGLVQAETFTFVQLSDTQLGIGGYEHDVRTFKTAVEQINALAPDFVVICGDLIHVTSDDQAYVDFKTIRAGFTMPCHVSPGNHDVGNTATPESLARYRRIIGPDYYSFDHKGYRFLMTNTSLWRTNLPEESKAHDAWFRQDLESAAALGIPSFTVGHYPFFMKTHDEPASGMNIPPGPRKRALGLMRRHGTVAALAGHIHGNNIVEHEGIQVVTSAATSRNFSTGPLGFRVWTIGESRPYKHVFVPLELPEPDDGR